MESMKMEDLILSQLTTSRVQIKEQLLKLEQRDATLHLMTQDWHKVDLTYKAVIHSLWATEGEKSVNAKSRILKRAITNAVKKHHKYNRRSDYQIDWEIFVKIFHPDEKQSVTVRVPVAVYKNLLPGGNPNGRLRIKK
jgi:hypothetical protein